MKGCFILHFSDLMWKLSIGPQSISTQVVLFFYLYFVFNSKAIFHNYGKLLAEIKQITARTVEMMIYMH